MTDPLDIATIRKNGLEEVRIALTEYHCVDLVDIRIFADFSGADGEKRATKKGVCLKVAVLPDLIAGLEKALERARDHGLAPLADD